MTLLLALGFLGDVWDFVQENADELRLGLQNTIWGKTELFRAQDQFNPQDLGLSSLPSLEESRIALWGARGTYSFYDVGPFEDVRVEVAFNFDDFEPADLGRCGEPYAPRPACDKAFGELGFSLTGLGVVGEVRDARARPGDLPGVRAYQAGRCLQDAGLP